MHAFTQHSFYNLCAGSSNRGENVNGIVNSLKCKMGNHQWSPLRYQRLFKDSQCVQVRDCQSCGLRETIPLGPHEWSGWEWSAGDPCHQERSCKRCGSREVLPYHDFEKVSTRFDGSGYLDVLRCKRCGRFEEQPYTPDHQQELRDEWGMN